MNGTSGKLSHSNDVIGACICSNDVKCVALPIVGAWSMAVFLWQVFEYLLLYYQYYAHEVLYTYRS